MGSEFEDGGTVEDLPITGDIYFSDAEATGNNGGAVAGGNVGGGGGGGNGGGGDGGDQPVEGGTISGETPEDIYAGIERSPPVAKTAAEISKWLLSIFGGLIVIHYLVMYVLLIRSDPSSAEHLKLFEFVERIFNTLLPVIAGLLGSAVAFYFSRERGKEP